MEAAPLSVVALGLATILGLVCGYFGRKPSLLRNAVRLSGSALVSFTAVIAWTVGYAPTEIQEIFLLRHTKDWAALFDGVVVGYALLIGAGVQLARHGLVSWPPMTPNSALLSDASSSLRCACGAAKRER